MAQPAVRGVAPDARGGRGGVPVEQGPGPAHRALARGHAHVRHGVARVRGGAVRPQRGRRRHAPAHPRATATRTTPRLRAPPRGGGPGRRRSRAAPRASLWHHFLKFRTCRILGCLTQKARAGLWTSARPSLSSSSQPDWSGRLIPVGSLRTNHKKPKNNQRCACRGSR